MVRANAAVSLSMHSNNEKLSENFRDENQSYDCCRKSKVVASLGGMVTEFILLSNFRCGRVLVSGAANCCRRLFLSSEPVSKCNRTAVSVSFSCFELRSFFFLFLPSRFVMLLSYCFRLNAPSSISLALI